MYPHLSYSAIYFLPDAQSDEVLSSSPSNISVDAGFCEADGYTYYSSGQCPAYHNQETCVFSPYYLKCDGSAWCRDNGYTLSSCTSPKVVNTQCPNGFSLYKYCVCPSTYQYTCSGTGYNGGSGAVCEGKYVSCGCSTGSGYVWNGSSCVCDSAYKYGCSGTGYSGGSGGSCGGKYKSCTCSTYYSWNGSTCAHVHSYVCPSGYSASNSGMITPTSTAKVCELSGCSSTSGTCYKETHSHTYACQSGYSASCSNGYSASSAMTCSHSSCNATSGTCYKCCDASYKYTCSGTGYSGGSGTACSGKYTSCTCASGYHWSGSACIPHSYSCPSGSYESSSSCSYGTSGTVSKKCSCGATSGTCYTCKACAGSTSCSGGVTSSSSCTYGVASSCTDCWGTVRYTCKSCSPLANETGCSYGTQSCSNGCGGTRTCCKACSPLANETGCSYGTVSCSNGCGGTRACCASCSNTCGSGSLSSSCTSPKTASQVATTQCGNKCYSCVCPSTYKYSCSGTGYSGGSGTACDGKYASCSCSSGYAWNGSSCAKTTVTITVRVNYGGGEYSYCGAGPFLAPNYTEPGATRGTLFPRSECNGQVDSTSITAAKGGKLRFLATPYVGISGCGVAYPCSGVGSCTVYMPNDIKNRYYDCEFDITGDASFTVGYCCDNTNLL